jgi:hypothetical protein
LAAAGEIATAQVSDLSGTWRLDKASSQITSNAGLSGLGAGGAPPTLYVTQAANGTITIGSDINESQARLYRLDGAGWIPSAPNETTAVTARRQNSTLIVVGTTIREELTLSNDAQTLTITVMNTGATPATSTLVYTRMRGVDPCERWPTPCRYVP